MSPVVTGRPGRPAAAARSDALELASKRFLAGERVDMQGVAQELGLARATMHRWFGTRELLLGEALAGIAEERLLSNRAIVTSSGAPALLESFHLFNRELTDSVGLRIWLEREQDRALRVLTSSAGVVQPRMVATVERMMRAEVYSGAFAPTAPVESLAYAIVRLAEAFLYNDAMIGIRGETMHLCEVLAALLRGA